MAQITDADEMMDVVELATKFLVCGTLRAHLPYDKVEKVREKIGDWVLDLWVSMSGLSNAALDMRLHPNFIAGWQFTKACLTVLLIVFVIALGSVVLLLYALLLRLGQSAFWLGLVLGLSLFLLWPTNVAISKAVVDGTISMWSMPLHKHLSTNMP